LQEVVHILGENLEEEDPKGIIVFQLSEYIEKLKIGFSQKIAFEELGLQARKIVKFVF
jgi:hypothetical protein